MDDLSREQLIELLENERAALRYAIRIIESYQMDIRDSEWTGLDLAAVGFCQGAIYTDALRMIESFRNGKRP